MRMPVYAEQVRQEPGLVWRIRDQDYNLIAQHMNETNAKLVVALLNKDWQQWQSRKGLPELSDTNEVEMQCCDEEAPA